MIFFLFCIFIRHLNRRTFTVSLPRVKPPHTKWFLWDSLTFRKEKSNSKGVRDDVAHLAHPQHTSGVTRKVSAKRKR